MEPTHIFLTHGHADHWGDVVDIAKRTGAQCVAIAELADELEATDRERGRPQPRRHGGVRGRLGALRARLAHVHHAGRHREHARGPRDPPGGKTIYHLGDTALFSDLRLVGERDELDAALVCIGGHYTMDRHDAVQACELIGARTVVPCHYGTFPPIETDDQAFKADVERRTAGEGRRQATVVILDPDPRSAFDVRQSHRARWNQIGRSFQSWATSAAPSTVSASPVAPWCTRWPPIHSRRRTGSTPIRRLPCVHGLPVIVPLRTTMIATFFGRSSRLFVGICLVAAALALAACGSG